jgi:hypothetical protein
MIKKLLSLAVLFALCAVLLLTGKFVWIKGRSFGIEHPDAEQIATATDEKVQIDTVNINPNPVFATGKSSGNLDIINDKHNHYIFIVEIYTDVDNQLIYAGDIEVGQKIMSDKLLVNLPKGDYDCTVHFRAINPDTAKCIRKVSTDIKITIKA